MLSEPFANVLRAGRTDFNAQFAQARRRHAGLDEAVFTEFLRDTVDPLVVLVAAHDGDRVNDLVRAAYAAGLELVGRRLVGAGTRWPEIGNGWRTLLRSVAAFVAAEPERMLASVSNALHVLSQTEGARPDWWIREMVRLSAFASTMDDFLRIGQVTAWRAGLAHFRESAIEVAALLPKQAALAAVGAPEDAHWPQVHRMLSEDPWWVPEGPGNDAPLRVGAFRGFGGLFPEPPLAAIAEGQLLVRSGDDVWLLTADAFGATFHRASPDDWPRTPLPTALPRPIEVRGTITSVAANSHTFAVTSALTHAITVAPLRPLR